MKTKRMSKLIGVLLALAMLASLTAAMGLNTSAATVPASGYTINEATSTYTVYNVDGLLAWRAAANNAAIANKTISDEAEKLPVPNLILAADIVLPQVAHGQSNWTPVGTAQDNGEYPYTGTIDGAGHTIYNMSISQNVAYDGFISQLSGTVKNLKFADVVISGAIGVGTVAGKLMDGTIENCHVLSGDIHGSFYVGGIVGYAQSSDPSVAAIVACSNGAHINAEGFQAGDHHHSYIGGIVGMQWETSVMGCYNYGRISGHGGATGGISGYAVSTSSKISRIIGSYAIGPVEITTENHSEYGGFAAILGTISTESDLTNVLNCYYILPTFTPTLGFTAATAGVGSCHNSALDPARIATTLVDGEIVSWADAKENMNTALAAEGYAYYINEGSDVAARPLVICTTEHPSWSHGICETCGLACDHANCTLSYQNLGDNTHVEIYDICGGQFGEPHPHSTNAADDKAATCTSPAYCSYCKSEYGTTDPNHHEMTDATCTAPKTCKLCGVTEGEALGHSWTAADCDTPKTCATCGTTEGEALGHKYDNACDADCNVCKQARIPAEHVDTDEDAICDECGAELPKKGLSGGAIAGIVIGSVAVAGGLGALLALLLLKKKKKGTEESAE